jgi:hypothetical protein
VLNWLLLRFEVAEERFFGGQELLQHFALLLIGRAFELLLVPPNVLTRDEPLHDRLLQPPEAGRNLH